MLLDWWLPRIREVLGDRFRSASLFGGTVLGGYMPGRSDVDVCSVIEEGVRPEDGDGIARVYDEMRARFVSQDATPSRYSYVIEGQYVPPEIARNSHATGDCYVTWGRTRQWLRGNPVTPFDRYSLAHFGLCVWGEDIHFAPPTRAELVGQLETDLKSLTDPDPESLGRPRWIAMMITWVARSMAFWRDGQLLTKAAALQREIDAGGPFTETYRLALAVRCGGPDVARDKTEALREHFGRIALSAASALRQLAWQ